MSDTAETTVPYQITSECVHPLDIVIQLDQWIDTMPTAELKAFIAQPKAKQIAAIIERIEYIKALVLWRKYRRWRDSLTAADKKALKKLTKDQRRAYILEMLKIGGAA